MQLLFDEMNSRFDQLNKGGDANNDVINEVNDVIHTSARKLSLKEVANNYENGKCSEQDKVYFLKTSKTGSTSVANILTRFGLR